MHDHSWHKYFIIHLAKLLKPTTYIELGKGNESPFKIIKSVATKASLVKKTATQFTKILKTDPIEINMLYINSQQSQDKTIKDLKALLPYVVEQGVILIRGEYHWTNQLKDFEMVTIPLVPGLTICRKRKEQVPWLSGKLTKESEGGWHGGILEYLAKLLKPRVYVELGMGGCRIFNRIVPLAKHSFGVDLDANCKHRMINSPQTAFAHQSTLEFAQTIKENPIEIDLLFIDADHSREAVLNDFKAFFPFVADNGMILLHDGYPFSREMTNSGNCDTAYQAIWELSQNNKEWEMMTLPLPPGLTLCRKRTKQLSWLPDDPETAK